MKNENLFRAVKRLNLPIGKYALFGSAYLGAAKLRKCHDIDIITTKNLWNKHKNKSGWERKRTPRGDEYLSNGGIELWKDWWPGHWNIEKLIGEAKIIDGLPFVRIEDIIRWKKLSGREKDLKDLKLLEKHVSCQK